MPSAMRRPARICGSAAGKTTRDRSAARRQAEVAPGVAVHRRHAAHAVHRGDDDREERREEDQEDRRAGCSTPKSTIATGIQASGEIGRSSWMTGLAARAAAGRQPRKTPTGIPSSERRAVAGADAQERVADVAEEEPLARELREAARHRAPARGRRRCRVHRTAMCQRSDEEPPPPQRAAESLSSRRRDVISCAPGRSPRRSRRAARGSAREERSRGCGRSIVTIRRMRAGRADITTTRSASCTDSSMSCVTKRIVLLLRLPDAQQLAAHDEPRDRVERAEGLVEESTSGFDGERARHLDALLHAARELVRIGLLEALEADELDVVRDAPLALAPAAACPGRSRCCPRRSARERRRAPGRRRCGAGRGRGPARRRSARCRRSARGSRRRC